MKGRNMVVTLLLTLVVVLAVVGCGKQKEYTLTIEVSPAGSGTVSPQSGMVYYGETLVTLNPQANSGWKFTNWSGESSSEVVDKEDGTWSILVNSDKALVANFAETSSDAILTNIEVFDNNGVEQELLPPFNDTDKEYFIKIQKTNEIHSVAIVAYPSDENATILIGEEEVEGGEQSALIPLVPGDSAVEIFVTAENGDDFELYTVKLAVFE